MTINKVFHQTIRSRPTVSNIYQRLICMIGRCAAIGSKTRFVRIEMNELSSQALFKQNRTSEVVKLNPSFIYLPRCCTFIRFRDFP